MFVPKFLMVLLLLATILSCRKIKRYRLDEHDLAVVVNSHIDIVESNVQAYIHIALKLLQDADMYTLFLHMLQLYDEVNDGILKLRAVSVS